MFALIFKLAKWPLTFMTIDQFAIINLEKISTLEVKQKDISFFTISLRVMN